MGHQTDIQNARRLEIFLQDDVVTGALDALEGEIHARWRAADTVDARELAHADLRALERFRGQLAKLVDRGTRAAYEESREDLPRS